MGLLFFTNAQRANVIYKESNDDFPNPERGFYIPYNVHAGNFIPLNEEKIKNNRTNLQKHGSATYPIFSTLVYREYVLDSFINKLKNVGYASPFNLRHIILVMRNMQTKKEYFITCKADLRRWYTGSIQWNESLKMPDHIPAGSYELLLSLPDSYASLAGRPEYSIRLANENIWVESTGYNHLNHTITINP